MVIRGSRGVGKSALFHRLQGKPLPAEYTPTPEIQIGQIKWTYKSSDDRIRVEIWDVVDRVLTDEVEVAKVDDEDAPAGMLKGRGVLLGPL